MKKIIVFASALALAGGASYAMEEDAMDKDMMMEAPAPSVTLAGSGEMGFENVDDDKDTGIQLIRAYKVAFSSSSTTDGGLVFGAGMSIRDDTTEENMPVTKGSHVYIGSADGSWKLQFGGNDPGIDLAGGIGVADDNFGGEDDESIALSGSIEGASYRITMARPDASGAADGDWSIGASYAINDISVGVGMDSESGLAIGVGTELAGLSTSVYYSQAEAMVADVDAGLMAYAGKDAVAAEMSDPVEDFYMAQVAALNAWETHVKTLDGNANVFADQTPNDNTDDALRLGNIDIFNNLKANAEAGKPTFLSAAQATAIDTFIATIPDEDPVEENDEVTNQDAVDASMTDNKAKAAAVNVNRTPLMSELNEAKVITAGSAAVSGAANVLAGTTEYKGFGAKVSVPAGEGTSFSIAYSSFKADTTPEATQAMFSDNGTAVTPYKGGSVKTTLIELGVSYDLGGGATLGAGIDKKSAESITISTEDGARVGKVSTADTTTLSASVAFSF